MARIENLKEWHKIGYKLCGYLKICSCQRKLKSFVTILANIYSKKEYLRTGEEFTGEEYMILAMLDSLNLIVHGTNCEYPIILENEFWDFINEVKDSPYLEDN